MAFGSRAFGGHQNLMELRWWGSPVPLMALLEEKETQARVFALMLSLARSGKKAFPTDQCRALLGSEAPEP